MTVRSVLTSPVVTIRQKAPIEEAAKLMLEHEIGCLPVLNADEELVGILTERDFVATEESVPWGFFTAPKLFDEWLDDHAVEEAYERARSTPVRTVMSKPVHTVDVEDDVSDAVRVMLKRKVSHVPVVEDDRVVGMITNRDMLRLLRDE